MKTKAKTADRIVIFFEGKPIAGHFDTKTEVEQKVQALHSLFSGFGMSAEKAFANFERSIKGNNTSE